MEMGRVFCQGESSHLVSKISLRVGGVVQWVEVAECIPKDGCLTFRGKFKGSIRAICYLELRFCHSGQLGAEGSAVVKEKLAALK